MCRSQRSERCCVPVRWRPPPPLAFAQRSDRCRALPANLGRDDDIDGGGRGQLPRDERSLQGRGDGPALGVRRHGPRIVGWVDVLAMAGGDNLALGDRSPNGVGVGGSACAGVGVGVDPAEFVDDGVGNPSCEALGRCDAGMVRGSLRLGTSMVTSTTLASETRVRNICGQEIHGNHWIIVGVGCEHV